MKSHFFICAIICSALLFVAAGAAGATEAAEATGSTEVPVATGGPIVITASTLSADGKARTALFEGSVLAKKGNISLHAGRMTVLYSEKGTVVRIDAEGDVRLVRGARVLTADRATYTAKDDSIVFTGGPKASENGNVITGTKITYMMAEDRSLIQNSTVFLRTK